MRVRGYLLHSNNDLGRDWKRFSNFTPNTENSLIVDLIEKKFTSERRKSEEPIDSPVSYISLAGNDNLNVSSRNKLFAEHMSLLN